MFKAAKLIFPNNVYKKEKRLDLFEKTNWLTSAERYEFYVLAFVHKNVVNASNLKKGWEDFFVKIPESNRETRNSDCFLLPRMHSEWGKKSFFYQAMKMWNALPKETKSINSSSLFQSGVTNILLMCRDEEFVLLNESRIINSNSA
jgi:hypothetical protein